MKKVVFGFSTLAGGYENIEVFTCFRSILSANREIGNRYAGNVTKTIGLGTRWCDDHRGSQYRWWGKIGETSLKQTAKILKKMLDKPGGGI